MAAPFIPPPLDGKPEVPTWLPPEPTRMELDWASLHTIDLSLLDSLDTKVVDGLVQLTKTAIKDDGFLYLINYGISLEQLHRQFSLAQYLHRNISDDDKKRLLWDPQQGVFAGFKRRLGWKREAGDFDGIEHFNFYRPQFEDSEDKVPECIKPFMDEIVAFCEYLTNSVNGRLLKLLSRVLELPDDYLFDNVQSHDWPVGDGYFRHALFYPLLGEDKERRKGVRMHYCARSLGEKALNYIGREEELESGEPTPYSQTNFSTALHIWSRGDDWQPVKYNPGALVVNLGEALEIISGGHFKATKHKVTDTPADQEHCERLSLVQFNASIGDMRLAPAMESPLLQREGFMLEQGVFQQYKRLIDAGVPVPTNKQWREIQVSTNSQIAPEKRPGGIKEINGVKYGADRFLNVDVLLPV